MTSTIAEKPVISRFDFETKDAGFPPSTQTFQIVLTVGCGFTGAGGALRGAQREG